MTRPKEDAADLVRSALGAGRRRRRGADDPDCRARGLGAARSRGHAVDEYALDRLHQRERRRSLHAAAVSRRRRAGAEGRQPVRGGPSTRDRLLRYGVQRDLVPADFRAEGVVDALESAGPLKGRTFLLPMADVGRERLSRGAVATPGAEVTAVVAYRTLPPETDPDQRPRHLSDAARPADRRGHVHERRQRPQLRARPSARSRPRTCSSRPWSRCAGR